LVGVSGRGLAHPKSFTYTEQHNTEKHVHTSTHQGGFEATIPVFERFKAFICLSK